MNKLIIVILMLGVILISGCEVYETLYVTETLETIEIDREQVNSEIIDWLAENNFEFECVEEETNEVQQKMYDGRFPFCSDICEISYFCREFMDEHNINTSGIPYLPKHIRNPILVTPDFCNFNTEDDWGKCVESCLDNYYEDELYRTINETICTKEILVRYNK